MAGPSAARTPEIRATLADPRFAFVAFGAVLLAVLPFIANAVGQTYLISLVSKMMIWAIAAASLDLILGYGGLVSFGHAAYLGLGSYAVALLSKNIVDKGVFDLPLWLIDNGYMQLLLAVASSALFAFVFGAISLRTSGVYFIMITLAFTQMLFYLGISLEPLGGDDGMNVNRSDFRIFKLSDNVLAPKGAASDGIAVYYAAFAVMVLTVIFLRRVVHSRFGMVIRGAYSNPVRMQAIGFATYRYRLAAFTLAGAICGIAGFLFANSQQFLTPVYMGWLYSGEMMVMVIIGGMGTIYGAVVGAFAFWTLDELLKRFVGNDYWMMVMGPMLVLLVLFAKKGFLSLMPETWRGMGRFFVGLAIFLAATGLYFLLLARTHPLYVVLASIAVMLALRLAQDAGKLDGLFARRRAGAANG
jgi:branched-chain amino acid transport system permease protein